MILSCLPSVHALSLRATNKYFESLVGGANSYWKYWEIDCPRSLAYSPSILLYRGLTQSSRDINKILTRPNVFGDRDIGKLNKAFGEVEQALTALNTGRWDLGRTCMRNASDLARDSSFSVSPSIWKLTAATSKEAALRIPSSNYGSQRKICVDLFHTFGEKVGRYGMEPGPNEKRRRTA